MAGTAWLRHLPQASGPVHKHTDPDSPRDGHLGAGWPTDSPTAGLGSVYTTQPLNPQPSPHPNPLAWFLRARGGGLLLDPPTSIHGIFDQRHLMMENTFLNLKLAQSFSQREKVSQQWQMSWEGGCSRCYHVSLAFYNLKHCAVPFGLIYERLVYESKEHPPHMDN